ncbi:MULTISPECIES: cyanophycin synthetase [unclassified Colwellia]|uniref:cyanophycin synthetase n=1 Tax=unclassified Colwellia TaxID=196834 RepID=UPI0015F68F71|nr:MULTISPECIES: cyanophycin synthetase [unclassified Colwellia]MBA6362278.1 cyanophycin synthetase [Colwellia sp. BRX8-8]MBA6348196.1 cyanophycin synthetase [Colwellia sp. BRX8-9]MBA6351378.1 cyanophycin synthetase [Colwellia sp. BRX9-1]MBA6354612.1 cyanophycin synthetase [Colwellia sp. BRX8-3]MBA6358975.1 cyanophycin synthetase [Colwellia sp. BRX8-6]
MKILTSNVYVGPNVYAHFPVIRHAVDVGILEQYPSVKLGKEFIDGLIEALPGLKEHGCSYGESGGFIRRLQEDEGTWIAHIWEHATLELQCMAGTEVTFGKTRGNGEVGQYDMVFQYKQRDVGLAAAELARNLLISVMPVNIQAQLQTKLEADFDFAEELSNFIRYAQRKEFGPSTQSLITAAEERHIPWLRLNQYSLVQFGHGKYQQRIQATITSQTNHIAVEISCDKEDTHNLLNDLGLPVPRQQMVYSAKDAIKAAKRIGLPVVLKPLNANHGRGVSIDLTTDEQINTAFDFAREQGTSRAVLVESFLTGLDHRMLVVNGELVAVAKRVPGHVVGDNKHTIMQLIDIVNEDPRRGVGHEKVLTQLEMDSQATRLVEEAGYSVDTILPEGEIFYLRSTANLSTGGTAIDMTDVVHPDNKVMAERAIKAVGLDVGGVDFLTSDITQSYKDIGGGIVEVNAAPGFRMHVAPSHGKPRDVAGKVIDMLFPPNTPTCIPIAGITGTNGKTTTSRMLSHILKTAGHVVGMTSTDGVYVDGLLSVKGDMTGPVASQIVLRDPSVDIAVLETARGGIVRSGLGYRESNVAACINVQPDHLGLKGVDTLEQLAEIKRIVVEVAKDAVILNADDPLCLKMADHTQAKHLCYVTMNSGHGLVREHIRAGGRAVVLEKGINGEMITIFDNGAHIPLLWTHLIPATLEGKATHNVQNAMFAAALAYSLDKPLDAIQQGLRTFNTTFYQAPGRMNVFDEHPFRVILDYAHNADGVRHMSELATKLDVNGKRIAVLAAPGDRRDEDIENIAKAAAGHFDLYICRADDNLRGRGSDEVPQMLAATLKAQGISEDNILMIPDEVTATEKALSMANKDDLVIVFGDAITRCWKQIINFNGSEDNPAETLTKPVHTVVSMLNTDEPDPFILESGMKLVKDDRGVRIVSTIEEESD